MGTKPEVLRVSVDLPRDFHRKVKSFAAHQGKSMREIVLESLTRSMEEADILCLHDHTPNERLERVLKNVAEDKNLVECKNIDDLFRKLRK
jgi:hypothetical protein